MEHGEGGGPQGDRADQPRRQAGVRGGLGRRAQRPALRDHLLVAGPACGLRGHDHEHPPRDRRHPAAHEPPAQAGRGLLAARRDQQRPPQLRHRQGVRPARVPGLRHRPGRAGRAVPGNLRHHHAGVADREDQVPREALLGAGPRRAGRRDPADAAAAAEAAPAGLRDGLPDRGLAPRRRPPGLRLRARTDADLGGDGPAGRHLPRGGA